MAKTFQYTIFQNDGTTGKSVVDLQSLWKWQLTSVEKRVLYHYLMMSHLTQGVKPPPKEVNAKAYMVSKISSEYDFVFLTEPFLRIRLHELHDNVEVVNIMERLQKQKRGSGPPNRGSVFFESPDDLPTWIREKIAVLNIIGVTEEITEGVGVKLSPNLYWVSNKEELPWRPHLKQK